MEQLRPEIYDQSMPKDPQAKEAKQQEDRTKFRQLDVAYRQDRLNRDELHLRGGYLLAGALIIMLLSAHWAVELAKQPPMPRTPIDQARLRKISARATWAVAVCGLMASGLAIAWLVSAPGYAVLPPRPTPGPIAGTGQTQPQPNVAFDAEALANWPRFRGVYGDGILKGGDVPQTWDAKTGKNILWKSEIPLAGMSSPIVWGNRVFITGGSTDKAQILCYDADNGGPLWAADARPTKGEKATSAPAKEIEEVSDINEAGPAAPTPATDGKLVFAIFPTGDLAAVNFQGNPKWSKSLGKPKSQYGYGTSLAICGQTLLVLLDTDDDGPNASRLLAFDCATGDELWTATRKLPASWSTPIIIQAAGKTQVITCADPWVISYDISNGHELWKASCFRGDVAPSPVFDGTNVYAVHEGARLVAIRPDGAGDVTLSHVAWKYSSDRLPNIASPLVTGGRVYIITTLGMLTCVDAANGNKLYEQQFSDEQGHPMNFHSSPTLAGGRIYIIADDGLTSVIEPGKEFKLLGTASLGEPCHTCPAFAKGRIYIRGTEHLFCIESGAGVSPVSSSGVAAPSSAADSQPANHGPYGRATHGQDAHATTENAPGEAP
jgi:outer membrane protein assembly factor BamB